MNQELLEAYTKCPECGAICLVGNDDDGQVHCAKCQTSFLPNETNYVTVEELEAICNKSAKEYVRGGWYAYDIK